MVYRKVANFHFFLMINLLKASPEDSVSFLTVTIFTFSSTISHAKPPCSVTRLPSFVFLKDNI